jgi:hypothetical protein
MLTALDQTPRPRKDPAAEEARKIREAGEGLEPEARGAGKGGGVWSGIGGFFSGLFSFLSPDDQKESEDKDKPPLRLSVQVVDAAGRSGKVLLNRYGAVRRPIEIRIQRRDDQQYAGNTEMVLQSYSIPLADFVVAAPDGLDLASLREVRLLFDESKAGAVVLDEIGFSRMNPAFLKVSAAR